MEMVINTEEGVDVPYEQINPETLHSMLSDYVSREWSELTDAGFTHEDKIEQVLQQLQEYRAKVLFDLRSNTWNIVSCNNNSTTGNERHEPLS